MVGVTPKTQQTVMSATSPMDLTVAWDLDPRNIGSKKCPRREEKSLKNIFWHEFWLRFFPHGRNKAKRLILPLVKILILLLLLSLVLLQYPLLTLLFNTMNQNVYVSLQFLLTFLTFILLLKSPHPLILINIFPPSISILKERRMMTITYGFWSILALQ